jgi:ubiquitin carboxyl-terminal hydrolase 8
MYLSLPVPNERSRKRVTLDDCLDSFVKEEIMEKGNAWSVKRAFMLSEFDLRG